MAAGGLGALGACPALGKGAALAPWELCVCLWGVKVQRGHGASHRSLFATLPTRLGWLPQCAGARQGPGAAAGAPGSVWVLRTQACSAPRGKPRGHICVSKSPGADSLQEGRRSQSESRRSPRAARVNSGGPLSPGEEGEVSVRRRAEWRMGVGEEDAPLVEARRRFGCGKGLRAAGWQQGSPVKRCRALSWTGGLAGAWLNPRQQAGRRAGE